MTTENHDLPQVPKSLLRHTYFRAKDFRLPLTEDMVVTLGRVFMEYLTKTPDGLKLMLRELHADVAEATYEKTYYSTNGVGAKDQELDYQHLVEYKGWIYKGKVGVGHRRVVVENQPPTEACDDCGGLYPKSYCTETVRNPGNDRLYTLCNHCRVYNQTPSIRDTADRTKCDNCRMTGCNFHPSRNAGYNGDVKLLEYKQRATGVR